MADSAARGDGTIETVARGGPGSAPPSTRRCVWRGGCYIPRRNAPLLWGSGFFSKRHTTTKAHSGVRFIAREAGSRPAGHLPKRTLFSAMDILFAIFRFLGILFLVLMVFNLLIIVHEWGHFLAGRWRGLYIDRFQIWFGKPLWKKKINGVQYGLGSIPAGGFVSLPQMAPMEAIEGKQEQDEETKKKPLPPVKPIDKIIVAFAGPLFSFLLAFAFACAVWVVKKPVAERNLSTTIGFVKEGSEASEGGLQVRDRIIAIDGNPVKRFFGMTDSVQWFVIASTGESIDFLVDRPGVGETHVPVPAPDVAGENGKKTWVQKIFKRPAVRRVGVAPLISDITVFDVEPGSPAEEAGLKPGDVVKKINGVELLAAEQAWDLLSEDLAAPINLELERETAADKTETLAVTVTPRKMGAEDEVPATGIGWNFAGATKYERVGPVEQVGDSLRMMFNTIKALVTPNSDVKPTHLSGPIGIMGVYYDLFSSPDGWRMMLWFSVVLNINLAVLNMLPFPVLDGGHIVFGIAEMVRGRPVNLKFLEVVQTAFVVLLLGFIAFVSLKDIGDRLPIGDGQPKQAAQESVEEGGGAEPAPAQ